MGIQTFEAVAPKPLVEYEPVGDVADSARVEAAFSKLTVAPLGYERSALQNP